MCNKTGFYAYCRDCHAMLRTQQRLKNHQAKRCNELIWSHKKRAKTKGRT